mmetsp:Transcript_6348/g.21837  ORF Transcript_6348/g.21837 Transcript_6348/m.21837 type:complete len:367 (+) Transcript_6348:35-1135(+)
MAPVIERRVVSAAATAAPSVAKTVTVLQWNVLADGLAQTDKFPVDPGHLEWEHRAPLILKELSSSGADIMCMQELNHWGACQPDDKPDDWAPAPHYLVGCIACAAVGPTRGAQELRPGPDCPPTPPPGRAGRTCAGSEEYFKPKMEELGYKGIFIAKEKSPTVKLGYPADGCSIFYRASRFEAVSEGKGEVYMGEDGSPMTQHNLRITLRDRETSRELVVATTHLKAKAGEEENKLRVAQTKQLLAGLQQDCSNPEGSVPRLVILAADFNTTPEMEPVKLVQCHPIGLQSVLQPEGLFQAHFSTWKFRGEKEKKELIDFMWHSKELEPVSGWAMPTEVEIGEKGLPNEGYPSDHLSLMYTFAIPPA